MKPLLLVVLWCFVIVSGLAATLCTLVILITILEPFGAKPSDRLTRGYYIACVYSQLSGTRGATPLPRVYLNALLAAYVTLHFCTPAKYPSRECCDIYEW
ncbi:uncharacterized protein BT62DRAFT_926020 [Guyanagaster necrorhizus]|uniref:Uncharacterized protein n=1 Tax=Guyanagaster necrorhizus TaxID=856835 RepID=A0A9P7W3N6_9AGAR|nr:uncharacterized protein BT62DRAFT_926020 [Guyanagaster necrorhizus MCA 3950]KAG7451840.1 hypothetical protein BT62DRAFT_926020 [Guyanagaster necrorhizus MCA 3950]